MLEGYFFNKGKHKDHSYYFVLNGTEKGSHILDSLTLRHNGNFKPWWYLNVLSKIYLLTLVV